MERIYLKEEDLRKYDLFCKNGTNEARIYDYNDKELIKYFHSIGDNKIDTLEEIDRQRCDLALVKELLIYKGLVYNHTKLKGILLDKGYGQTLSIYGSDENNSWNDKIIVLQNVGKVLEQLKWLRMEGKLTDFFIGDLQERNILVDKNTKKVQFIDLDSCKIGSNRAFLTKHLEFLKTYSYVKNNLSLKYPYEKYNFSNNFNTDLYCYMVVILKILFNTDITWLNLNDFYQKMASLKNKGLPEPLYEIFINLYSPKDNVNPYKLLDSMPDGLERKLNLK